MHKSSQRLHPQFTDFASLRILRIDWHKICHLRLQLKWDWMEVAKELINYLITYPNGCIYLIPLKSKPTPLHGQRRFQMPFANLQRQWISVPTFTKLPIFSLWATITCKGGDDASDLIQVPDVPFKKSPPLSCQQCYKIGRYFAVKTTF